jgi:2-polyprenyl-3-methyl-5-hydroxy-6-metoxy-1,4-benzoquinol methylase
MSTSHQIATKENGLGPAERLRRAGQAAGLWNHGFDLPHACGQIFRGVDLPGKSLLEIGCGKGVLCLWAALHGAREVIGLEPLAQGAFDSSACHKGFQAMANQLDLPQARISPLTIQEYAGSSNRFDIVLSAASINHLDEESCIRLRESPLAVQVYERLFRRIAAMMKPGGSLIVVDAARRNVFGDLGLRNPMTPSIEWFKHQQPEYWAQLLGNCGFGQTNIRWVSGRLLRYVGINALPKFLAYFGQSVFRLEMRRLSTTAGAQYGEQVAAGEVSVA